MTEFGPLSYHESKKDASDYKLFAISHHSGNLNNGHYTADVKDLDSGNWYNCNDKHTG